MRLPDLVLLPPLSHRIEAFKGETVWIDTLVTGVARLVLLMLLDLLPERLGMAMLRFEGRDTLGWR